jgi:tetratricopeptide (TPR) repeat protein
MASISLRAYHRQIEEWIDQGLYDQAIAHCRHILKYYPKCLETYRLLGKAFLESQKFGDANDIFQRILSSLPDDFISHVGMSIIREDESNLNEAIWHMERAFEIQPSNNAIQGELRRLYGRRDGIEPPKVNLNRSALARMYLKGNLHSQAIAEIRMALAEEPQRPDLDVLLAKAYFETKQIPEAKEIANQILAKLPYCYEAIYLLWQISLHDGKETEAERHLTKLAELDPYAAHLNKNISSTELVPDTAVLLEKLESSSLTATQATSQQPEWAASLGLQINAEEEKESEPSLPDWMKEVTSPAEAVSELEEASEILFEPAETTSESVSTSEIPEWMRELGWEKGQGAEEEAEVGSATISPYTEGEDLEELEAGEIPDWLKEISPVDEIDLSSLETISTESIPYLEDTPPAEGDSIATWLAGIETEKESLEATSPPDLEDVPDWVNELNHKSHLTAEISPFESDWSNIETQEKEISETPLPTTEITQVPQPTTAPTEDLPAWLTEEEPLPNAEQLPDWLLASYDEETFLAESEPAISEEDTKPVRVQPKEELQPEQPATIDQTFPALTDDDAFAWLESLAAKQGAQEALLLSPEERKEEPPEWIREYLDSKPDLAESEPSIEMASSLSDSSQFPIPETTEQLEGIDLTPAVSEELESDELPEWLRAELEKGQQLESAAISPSESEIPDWLASVTQEENIEWIQEFPGEETAVITPGETISIETAVTDDLAQFQEISKAEGSLLPEMELPQEDRFETSQPQLEEITLPLVETEESIVAKSEVLFQFETPITEGEQVTPLTTEAAEKVSIPPERETSVTVETPVVEQEAVERHKTESFPYTEGVVDSQYEIQVEEARLALSNGMFDQAIEKYQTLIKQRFELDQIIQDLSNALYHYPMEVRMWMLLGDAYLRKDLLSEALEAYNKAEELLR